jgi:hypothetical protein
MAANAGTNPGSAPGGVTVGVGDVESVGEGDASGEGDALGVDAGPGRSAAVGVHPPRTMAIAMASKP